MDTKETQAFAQQLMKEVWEPFDSEAVSRFFHPDVVGWHRRADSSWQELGYADVVNRLTWDKETNANPLFDVRDIIAEEDRIALRFLYTADFIPTGGKIDVEMMYFYRLRRDKVAEFGLLASVDFDFKAKGTEGTHEVTSVRKPHMPEVQFPRSHNAGRSLNTASSQPYAEGTDWGKGQSGPEPPLIGSRPVFLEVRFADI